MHTTTTEICRPTFSRWPTPVYKRQRTTLKSEVDNKNRRVLYLLGL